MVIGGGSTSQDLCTYQPPEHVVGMGSLGFLAIRRFEGYPRTILDRVSVHKKRGQRTLFPHFALLRDPGWSSPSRLLSRKPWPNSYLRTNLRTNSGSPHLAQWPYWMEETCRGDRVSFRVGAKSERLDNPRAKLRPAPYQPTCQRLNPSSTSLQTDESR